MSKIKNLKVGEISEEIIVADKIIILKILDKRKIKNNIDINLVKNILEEKGTNYSIYIQIVTYPKEKIIH